MSHKTVYKKKSTMCIHMSDDRIGEKLTVTKLRWLYVYAIPTQRFTL